MVLQDLTLIHPFWTSTVSDKLQEFQNDQAKLIEQVKVESQKCIDALKAEVAREKEKLDSMKRKVMKRRRARSDTSTTTMTRRGSTSPNGNALMKGSRTYVTMTWTRTFGSRRTSTWRGNRYVLHPPRFDTFAHDITAACYRHPNCRKPEAEIECQ